MERAKTIERINNTEAIQVAIFGLIDEGIKPTQKVIAERVGLHPESVGRILREETITYVSPAIKARSAKIITKMAEQAELGDVASATIFFKYGVGEPDRIDATVRTDTVYIAPDQPDELPMESQTKDSLPLNP